MKYLKNNLKVIISFILGIILASGITVYATSYFAKDITYTREDTNIKSVEDALNELYTKTTMSAQQVGTITAQGTSYTFQHKGYIIGSASPTNGSVAELHFDNGTSLILTNDYPLARDVSVYVPEGITVTTRSDGGSYNLTLYEFK